MTTIIKYIISLLINIISCIALYILFYGKTSGMANAFGAATIMMLVLPVIPFLLLFSFGLFVLAVQETENRIYPYIYICLNILVVAFIANESHVFQFTSCYSKHTYINKKYNFSCTLPKGWEAEERFKGSLVLRITNSNTGNDQEIYIALMNNIPNRKLIDLNDGKPIDDLPRKFKLNKKHSKKQGLISGYNFLWERYIGEEKAVVFVTSIINNKIFLIAHEGDPRSFKNYEVIFKTFIDSINLTNLKIQ